MGYNADVMYAQAYLAKMGFDLTDCGINKNGVDGISYKGTESYDAITTFQRLVGAEATGKVDASLLSKMDKAVSGGWKVNGNKPLDPSLVVTNNSSINKTDADTKRQSVVDEALYWNGKIPYCLDSAVTTQKLDKTNPPPYMDCADFTSSVYYTEFNVKIGVNCAGQKQSGTSIDVSRVQKGDYSSLKKGDLVFFDWPQGLDTNNDNKIDSYARDGKPNHVSIYIGGGEIIHETGSNTNPNNLSTDPNKSNVKIESLDKNWGSPYGKLYENVVDVQRIVQDDGTIKAKENK